MATQLRRVFQWLGSLAARTTFLKRERVKYSLFPVSHHGRSFLAVLLCSYALGYLSPLTNSKQEAMCRHTHITVLRCVCVWARVKKVGRDGSGCITEVLSGCGG